jgi:hypothetical protein
MSGGRMDAALMGQISLWLTAVIFGAGGIYARISDTSVELDRVTGDLIEHRALASHPVGQERLETVMTEQRALRAEVTAQGRSIAAICQATGATCD